MANIEWGKWGNLLFGFNGRIDCNQYRLWLLLFVAGLVAVGFVGDFAGATVSMILVVLFWIGAFISGSAVGIKRLHDRNKSGWWLLVFNILPIALIFFSLGRANFLAIAGGTVEWAALVRGGMGSILLSLAAAAILIWGGIELAYVRGTVGPNQYGPDPFEASPLHA
jgi:uncharacterized membrane protein YhaH (DUF805 family)